MQVEVETILDSQRGLRKYKENRTMLRSALFVALVMLSSTSEAFEGSSWLSPAVKISDSFKSLALSNRLARSSSLASEQQVQRRLSEEQTENKELNIDIGSKCLIERDPQFRDWPSVRFFSNKMDSINNTSGCFGGIKFDLNLTDWMNDEYANGREYPKDDIGMKKELMDSNKYNPNEATFFLIHGFLAAWSSDPWMCKMKDMILNNSNSNVFIVDWSGGAKPQLPIDYSAAVTNVNSVAQLLGTFTNILLKISNQNDARKFQFVGHSLGAHISGFVGYLLKGKVGRITAFDPAGPCFTSKIIGQNSGKISEEESRFTGILEGDRHRLSRSSAQLVVALHTDTPLFGLNENSGHVDVYVNGGQDQPGCPSNTLFGRLGKLIQFKFSEGLSLELTCSHSYSHNLSDTWAANLEERKLRDDTCYPIAYQCRSWNAFKAGECGTCTNEDSKCVYVGLASQPKGFLVDKLEDDDEDPEDDSNDADRNGEGGESKANNSNNNNNNNRTIMDLFDSKGRHFMKASDTQPSCMYHYQIIVGTDKANLKDTKFEVMIPLGNGQTRTVVVSHQIRTSTRRHKRIAEGLLDLYPDRLDTKSLKHNVFHTALITFKYAPSCDETSRNETSSDKYWTLCKPLSNFKDLQVSAPNGDDLDAAKWVSVNYMSGLSLESRKIFSYLSELGDSHTQS